MIAAAAAILAAAVAGYLAVRAGWPVSIDLTAATGAAVVSAALTAVAEWRHLVGPETSRSRHA